MRFHEVDLASLRVSKMRGPVSKRFGQVTIGDTKEKMMFQLPGARLLFQPNDYNSILVSITNEDFVVFLEELKNLLLSELIDLETIDMGLKQSMDYPPSFRVKFSDETGYYDEDGKRADKTVVLEKGNDIHILCQLHCTYQMDGRAGVSWKAIQIRKGIKAEDIKRDHDETSTEYQFLD